MPLAYPKSAICVYRLPVHLEKWPETINLKIAEFGNILEEMNRVRKIVELGLAERKNKGIKIRQPLRELIVKTPADTLEQLSNDYVFLIKDELNVKNVKFIKGNKKMGDKELEIILDTSITSELKLQGLAREIVRAINSLRKEAGLSINNSAKLYYADNSTLKKVFAQFGKDILQNTLCADYKITDMNQVKLKKDLALDGEKFLLGIEINL
jgi:isoleucyl-tRNA synthetase